jgi:hypothetical protein
VCIIIALESLIIGKFVRSIPNAIGKSNNGSNFFTIAKYNNTQATTIIMIVLTAPIVPVEKSAKTPVFSKKFKKLFNNVNHHFLQRLW